MARTNTAMVTLIVALAVSLTGCGRRSAHVAPTRVAIWPQIPSNCSVDVTDALNWYFAKLGGRHVVDLPTNGCYRLQAGGLHIDGKRDLTINGHSTTFERVQPEPGVSCGDAAMVHLTNDSHVTFDRVNLDGSKNPWTAADPQNNVSNCRAGYDVESTFGLTIRNGSLANILADGIKMQSNSVDVVIAHNRITNVGRNGITFQWITGSQVIDNTITDAARHSMDIETNASSHRQSGLEIVANRLSCWLIGPGGAISGTANPGPATIVANAVVNPPTLGSDGRAHCHG